MEHERSEEEFSLRSNGSRDCPIRGMESVVATVSGYHGSERFKLIKLINQTGANYVGALTKSTTHLVCWKFEGRKYDLAKEFGTKIVSHRWFEDCVKEGKRLPERRYVMQSGIKAGSISWELPVACVKESVLTTKDGNGLSDRSNIYNDSMATQSDNIFLEPSFPLLRESLVPDLRQENKNFRKNKKAVGSTKQDSRFSCKHYSLEKPFSGVVREQHEASSSYSPIHSGKQKRSVPDAVGSAVRVEPTRKSRRLVKKNASRDIYESLVFDLEQEPDPIEFRDQVDTITTASNNSDTVRSDNTLTMLSCEQECSPSCNHGNITTASNNLNVLRNVDAFIPEQTSLQDGFRNGENRNEEPEDIEDITRLNNMPTSNGPDTSNDDLLVSQERSSPTGFSDFKENVEGVVKDVSEFREPNRLPTSTELSCVICWTDFSSTRGILPCGHRFCYSCIHNWADHLASGRKASTCPLCKASFMSITKVDDAVSSDQKIYSQTIPCASSSATDIFVLSDWEISRFGVQSASVCCECRSREPEDLLVSCHLCQNRWVHSYCLDPPLIPWTCVTCRDLRMLYQRIR